MELIIEIFLRVLANSFFDFVNLKSTSRIFWEAGNDEYIYQQGSLRDFPISPWWRRSNVATRFMDRCLACGNPDALFRHGLVCKKLPIFLNIFGRNNFISILFSLFKVILINFSLFQIGSFDKVSFHSGITYLQQAADKGHMEALYTLGIVLLFNEDESNIDMGKQIIMSFQKSDFTKIQSINYRFNLKAYIKSLWKSDDYYFYTWPIFCNVEAHYKDKNWCYYSRHENTGCANCIFDLEIYGLFWGCE